MSGTNAVLWLLDDNAWATANLKNSFLGHGVPEEKVIFAKRCVHAEYKRRLSAIDIYLDTFPYNAGVYRVWDVLEDRCTYGYAFRPLLHVQSRWQHAD